MNKLWRNFFPFVCMKWQGLRLRDRSGIYPLFVLTRCGQNSNSGVSGPLRAGGSWGGKPNCDIDYKTRKTQRYPQKQVDGIYAWYISILLPVCFIKTQVTWVSFLTWVTLQWTRSPYHSKYEIPCFYFCLNKVIKIIACIRIFLIPK